MRIPTLLRKEWAWRNVFLNPIIKIYDYNDIQIFLSSRNVHHLEFSHVRLNIKFRIYNVLIFRMRRPFHVWNFDVFFFLKGIQDFIRLEISKLHSVLYFCLFRQSSASIQIFPRNFIQNSHSCVRIKFLESLALPRGGPWTILEPVYTSIHICGESGLRFIPHYARFVRGRNALSSLDFLPVDFAALFAASSSWSTVAVICRFATCPRARDNEARGERENRRQHQSLPIAASSHFVCIFTVAMHLSPVETM